MANYAKLWDYLEHSNQVTVRLTFDDIEKLVGFKPGHGFIFDKLESAYYGYQAIDYSYKEQYVVFEKINKAKKDADDFTTLNTMGLI